MLVGVLGSLIKTTRSYYINQNIFRCSHCKRLTPIWEDLAKEFVSKDNIAIANVDCTVDAELCSSQDITGYPT